jgi:hypothetical protein
MTRITATSQQIASWLDSGYRLTASQFTFSIPGESSIWPGYDVWDEPNEVNYAYPDSNLANGFKYALGLWDDLIAPDFVEVADNALTRGEVRIAISDIDEDFTAYAYFPTYVGGRPGDIWINALEVPDDWSPGSYGHNTLVHEIGHTLGIDHPFESPFTPPAMDSVRFTVMSYTWITERYVSFEAVGSRFFAHFDLPVPETPMVLDIAVAQAMYGIETTTRTGDNTYSFAAMGKTLQTIYDAGGMDTIDLAGISYTNVVDLTPGAYSSIGVASISEQIAYWSAKYPKEAVFIREIFTDYLREKSWLAYTFNDNVAIALTTVIENVKGGSGRDEVSGNAAANLLLGNGGEDMLAGLAGADRLEGGTGNDQLYGEGVVVLPTGLATTPYVVPVIVADPDVKPDPDTKPDPDVKPDPIIVPIGGGETPIRLNVDVPAGIVAPPSSLRTVVYELEFDGSDPKSGQRLVVGDADDATPTPDPVTPPPPPPPPSPPPPPAPPTVGFDDQLLGGDGNDLLVGGAGRDYLSGGTGADLFRFFGGDFAGATVELADVIFDFSEAEGDRIDLSAIDAFPGIGDDGFRFLGNAAFTGGGAELRTVQRDGFLLLEGDISPNGVADFAIRLDGLTSLSVGAIII